MKRVLLLALGAFGVAQLGAAASCTSGTLMAYAALGATGCTINGSTLSNFQVFTSGTFGATEVPALSVNITPNTSLYSPGLTISTNQTAPSGNPVVSLFEIFFTYQISGQMYVGTSSVLSGAAETGNGAVSAVVNYCSGGLFGPDGLSNCTGTSGTLATVDGFSQSDQNSFSKVSSIAVTDDFTIDASGGGTARGGTFTNSFAAVPEPVTTAFTGLGLALLAAIRLRSSRANREIN